ncbi:hypothetical protein PMKS-003447 [Pichia membranifaciens]|uniref:DASH complex subunit ASK1 n=1 Tax=Pichia membranifaciens TaxID=4926 RepID=A0A1Q2YKE3_9ASCO|nr:hypothetical protein PMKS-003447 [Pichia membranifaciens]
MKGTDETGKQYEGTQNVDGRNGIEDVEADDDGTDKQPRLSFYFESSSIKHNTNRERVLDEVDRVEQLITLNLQKINENLMQSNNIVSNKLIPSLEAFNKNSNKIYNNISHIKEFFENAANVNILTKKDIKLQQMDGSDNSQEGSGTGDSNDNIKIVGGSSDFERNGSANNITSELSEFKDIKDRYKQNLESAGEKDVTVTHTATTLKLNRLPDYLKDNSNSVGTETFLKDFRMNAEDESTGRQLKRQNLAAHTPEMGTYQGSRENAGPSEDNLANSYVKDIMAGYESPPWEEPPVLQSSRFTSGHTKKRKRRPSSAHEEDEHRGSKGVRDRSTAENSKDAGTGAEEEEEEEEKEEEEEVSIRFPSSPKYGAGGKLLRTDKGRQRALDFARSEMMKNHPILSLQPQEEPLKRKLAASTLDPFDTTGERSDTTNSTLDDTPELMSELLSRRRQRREDPDQG